MPTWLTYALEHATALVTVAESLAHIFSAASAEINGSDNPVTKTVSVMNDLAAAVPEISAAVVANTAAADEPVPQPAAPAA